MSLPKEHATRAFWLNHNPLANYHTTPTLPTSANVVIIGLGLTGTGALFNLTQKHPDFSVVALEARDPVSGATGRNGGHLTPSSFRGYRRDTEKLGEKPAYLKRLLERHNVDQLVNLIHTHSIPCDLQEGTGNLQCFCNPEEFADAKLDLEAFREADKQYGGNLYDDIEVWENTMVLERLGNNGVYGAILIPAHQLWPAKLCWALQQECTKNKNVNIQSHTPVTKINRSSSGKWQVDTPRGTVICDVVLHASNAWSGALLPIDLQKALIPTRAQVIAFHSPQDKDIDVTQWTRGFSLHYGSEYMIRRRKDGVYVVGGGRENIPGQQMYENDDSILNRDVGKALRTFLNTHFPSLLPTNERSFQEWTGIMCYTYDGQPIVGHVPETPGQYVAVGYNGHGMPFAFQSGQFIADQASIFLTGSDADSKLIGTQDLELIQQAWQMYNPQRFHQNGHEMTHEKAGESQGLNATNSIPTGPSNTPLARILRNKRYRHWILLVLAFLIVAQYSICCK